MSFFKQSFQFFVLTAMSVFSASVNAEQYHPFAESLDVDPDWKIFAPVDIQELEEMHPRKRANHGWYVTYDRMHIGFDRPETARQSSNVDMTWGNRFDVGFMNESNKGFLFSYANVAGPNVYDEARYSRLLLPAAGVERFALLRPRFPFDPTFGDGSILVHDSLNVGSLLNLEFNKTWRFTPYHYGGILEPMVGFRYMGFTDVAQNENYSYIQAIDITNSTTTLVSADQLITQTTKTFNRMALAQLGYRYTQPVKRFTFSHDGRFFAGPNFQTQSYRNTVYAYTAAGNPVTSSASGEPFRSFSGRDNSEFVVGMDLRLEAAYQVTKSFCFRGGTQLLYIGRGIWRGNNPGFGPQDANDQNLVSPAFTFGATFNR